MRIHRRNIPNGDDMTMTDTEKTKSLEEIIAQAKLRKARNRITIKLLQAGVSGRNIRDALAEQNFAELPSFKTMETFRIQLAEGTIDPDLLKDDDEPIPASADTMEMQRVIGDLLKLFLALNKTLKDKRQISIPDFKALVTNITNAELITKYLEIIKHE